MRNDTLKRTISIAVLVMMLAKIAGTAWSEHVHAADLAHPPVEIGTGDVALPPPAR